MYLYFRPWQIIALAVLTLFLGMVIWRLIHVSCVNSRLRKEARFRMRRTHSLDSWQRGYYGPRSL